jgi:hypothetical protein
LGGAYCATGSYCDTDGQCQVSAKVGDDCSEDGTGGPLCDGCDDFGFCYSGLSCISGSCQYVCEINADCDEDEFCDAYAIPAACEPFNLEGCYSDDECPAEDYCYLPGNACYDYDGDPDGCGTLEQCSYDDGAGYCDPTGDALDGSCKPKIETGEACVASNFGADCASGSCTQDDNGDYRCEVLMDGCSNNNGEFLHFTFLFGWMVALRLRKKRE